MTQHALSPQQAELKNAFEAFNEMSQQLAESYRVLENKVVHLDQELASAQSERLRELTEKERVADRLQSLLKALPAGVVVLDNDGVVVECNPAAIDLLGEPLDGQAWIDVIHRAFAPQNDDGHDISLRDGRIVSLSTQPLGSEPGQLLLIQNVTETRALQERLNRSKRLSDMGEMAASLAHQIRTPLSSALLYSSHLMQRSIDAEKRINFTHKIRASMQQLENQVNDMLMFAKGGSAGGEKILINNFVQKLYQSMDIQLQQHNAEMNVRCDTSDMYVLGTEESLLGACQNLISNALNACKEKPRLVLTAKKIVNEGMPMVSISLQDNGPGIPETNQKKVFEPFFTTESRGTGLGLAVVKAVVNAHNGIINLESTLGVGSTFSILLPEQDADINDFTQTSIRYAQHNARY